MFVGASWHSPKTGPQVASVYLGSRSPTRPPGCSRPAQLLDTVAGCVECREPVQKNTAVAMVVDLTEQPES